MAILGTDILVLDLLQEHCYCHSNKIRFGSNTVHNSKLFRAIFYPTYLPFCNFSTLPSNGILRLHIPYDLKTSHFTSFKLFLLTLTLFSFHLRFSFEFSLQISPLGTSLRNSSDRFASNGSSRISPNDAMVASEPHLNAFYSRCFCPVHLLPVSAVERAKNRCVGDGQKKTPSEIPVCPPPHPPPPTRQT